LNPLAALPPALQLIVLGVIGLAVGSLVNAGIYSLAWFSRPISPWQRPHPTAPPRRTSDFVPIVGWLGLARESSIHGRGFWIRPLVIELLCAAWLPALYWWEVWSRGLAPPDLWVMPPPPAMLFHNFLSHAVLVALMLVATFIDFDEKTIPDEITVPGAIIGLVLVALWPDAHFPVIRPIAGPVPPPVMGYAPLLLTSTSDWPAWLSSAGGLALGVTLFVAWCLALIPALATLRRGWRKGIQYYFASMSRESLWWKYVILAFVGSAAIAFVWRRDAGPWQGLLSSLVGLGVGGGLVWAVRVAGRIALQKEAMGFGDVTLMAMIGAYLGWQPCLMIFFVSPFVAILIAVVQFVLTGRRDIPYGPYLCASTAAVIIWWPWFWSNFGTVFAMGWLLPGILAVCVLLMMAMLTAWRVIERAIWPS
jgi:leader peptidase (prepilin peptidase) / N-methyltransferase